MKYPRLCIVCDTRLRKRNLLGIQKDLVECHSCHTRYNKVFIRECDPEDWEAYRLSKHDLEEPTFEWDPETKILRFPRGAGLNPLREHLKHAV